MKVALPSDMPTILKGTITNSLKPPLAKRPSEVDYWKLNEMTGSVGCLRQKNLQAT